MKKLIGIALVLALAVMLMPSAVFAADPVVVNLGGTSDRLSNGVTGSFVSGIVNWNIDATTGIHKATTTMNVVGGDLLINSCGIDTTTCHPGVVGEMNGFQGVGAFTATYNTSTNGDYGILGTYVNAASKAGEIERAHV